MVFTITSNSAGSSERVVLESLSSLKHKMVGDQAYKVQLFVQQEAVFEELLRVDGSDVVLKGKSLDLLLSLMNLEVEARNELDHLYVRAASRILDTIEIDRAVPAELCLKGARLMNLCVSNCGVEYKDALVCIRDHIPGRLPEILLDYLRQVTSKGTKENEIVVVQIAIELMHCLLKCEDVVGTTGELQKGLEELLLSIMDRYATQLELKYILNVNVSAKAREEEFMALSNKGIQMHQPLPFVNVPRAMDISNSMDESLLWLGTVLYIELFKKNPTKMNLWLRPSFTLFICGLLKSSNTNLRACAVKFLVTPYFFNPKDLLPMQHHQLWLPYLVDLINYSDIPWWIDPIETLTGLVVYFNGQNPLNNEIIEFLYRTNLLHGLITVFVRCLSLDYQTSASMSTITSFLKLFAQVTGNDEKCRLLLLEDSQLMQHIEHALQTHLDLLNMFLLNATKMQNSLEPGDKMPPFYTSAFTLAWVTLLKSFSRSVNSLRTRLRRTTLGEQFLQLVQVIYLLLKNAQFASDELLIAELDILAMVFAVISNFAMEFSILQVYMVKHGILQMAHDILVDPLFNDQIECDEACARYKQRFPPQSLSAVKVNVLWMLKHLIYNSTTEDKIDLLKVIPMDTILEYINAEDWAVQEQCLQLLRNLTCNSRKVINMLLYHFRDRELSTTDNTPNTSAKSTYLFEFLTHKLRSLDPKDPHQMGAIISIIHIVVNFTVINESKRQMIIEEDSILEIVKEILSESDTSFGRFCNNEDAKLGCIWMLTNLIWNSSFSSYTHSAPLDYTPTAPTSVSSLRPVEELRTAQFEAGVSAYTNDSEGELDVEGMIDETGDFVRLSMSSTLHENPALLRYRKLEGMGFYELIHERTFDEYLNVRERARTLLFHMDTLRKSCPN